MVHTDVNGHELEAGDVIDLHQTVNGENLFVVLDPFILDIRYATNMDRKYEYDKDDMLKPCPFGGEVSYEKVGNIYAFIDKFRRATPVKPDRDYYISKCYPTENKREAEQMRDQEQTAYKLAMQLWWDSLTKQEQFKEQVKDINNQLHFYITF